MRVKDERESALAAGFQMHLSKPVEPAALGPGGRHARAQPHDVTLRPSLRTTILLNKKLAVAYFAYNAGNSR
jgi:CheY-like chemotaxis protein